MANTAGHFQIMTVEHVSCHQDLLRLREGIPEKFALEWLKYNVCRQLLAQSEVGFLEIEPDRRLFLPAIMSLQHMVRYTNFALTCSNDWKKIFEVERPANDRFL